MARRRGIDPALLQVILSGEKVPCPSLPPRENAVVGFVDALALSPADIDEARVYEAADHLGDRGVAQLVLIVAAASALNRIVMFSDHLSRVLGPTGQ